MVISLINSSLNTPPSSRQVLHVGKDAKGRSFIEIKIINYSSALLHALSLGTIPLKPGEANLLEILQQVFTIWGC